MIPIIGIISLASKIYYLFSQPQKKLDFRHNKFEQKLRVVL